MNTCSWFTAGAVSASFIFYSALGYGTRLLRAVFTEARAWRILDFLIGCVTRGIALQLLLLN